VLLNISSPPGCGLQVLGVAVQHDASIPLIFPLGALSSPHLPTHPPTATAATAAVASYWWCVVGVEWRVKLRSFNKLIKDCVDTCPTQQEAPERA
jgi:hypothetical protein